MIVSFTAVGCCASAKKCVNLAIEYKTIQDGYFYKFAEYALKSVAEKQKTLRILLLEKLFTNQFLACCNYKR